MVPAFLLDFTVYGNPYCAKTPNETAPERRTRGGEESTRSTRRTSRSKEIERPNRPNTLDLAGAGMVSCPRRFIPTRRYSIWIPTIAPFDSRFGICAAKWARPVAGTAKDAIERQRRDEPDYVPPSPREIEAKFVSVRKALSKLEEMSSDSRTSPFILGARLAIRHAEAIAAELDGRNPGKFPEKETERFFGLEQSASSAAVSSSLVWAPLAGNDSAGTAAK